MSEKEDNQDPASGWLQDKMDKKQKENKDEKASEGDPKRRNGSSPSWV